MSEREYFGIRKGFIQKDNHFTLDNFRRAFLLFYEEFERQGYFQKYFGKECVDGNDIGELGPDISMAVYLETGIKIDSYSISEKIFYSDEVELYTIIEFLYDTCSKPIKTRWHDFAGCGMHVLTSDDTEGRNYFRNKINSLLKRYKKIELSEQGEILEPIEEGFENLFNAPIPSSDEENITSRVNAAILKFRRASASVDDRRDALKNLADVLEYIRPQIEALPMSNDTKELFIIANKFGIRHHNKSQKDDYDKGVWHSWIFYCYLSTIHLGLRLIKNV